MKKERKIDDPLYALNATEIAAILGISRAGAYELLHSKGFPTLRIGKRMVCPRYKLEQWMENSIETDGRRDCV